MKHLDAIFDPTCGDSETQCRLKESFYVWLSHWSGPGQIVVLENEPVEPAVAAVLQATEFTDSYTEGRQGFCPPRHGIEASFQPSILDDGDEDVEDDE